jgi:hypothetical protein
VAPRLTRASCPPGPLCVGVAWGPAGRGLKTKSSSAKTKSPRPAKPSLAAAPTCRPGRPLASGEERPSAPTCPPPGRVVDLSPQVFSDSECLPTISAITSFKSPRSSRASNAIFDNKLLVVQNRIESPASHSVSVYTLKVILQSFQCTLINRMRSAESSGL